MSGNNRPWHHHVIITLAMEQRCLAITGLVSASPLLWGRDAWQQQALASSCQHHPCHGAEMPGNNRPWHHHVSITLAMGQRCLATTGLGIIVSASPLPWGRDVWQQQALASSCHHHPCHGAEMSGNNRPWHHHVSITLAMEQRCLATTGLGIIVSASPLPWGRDVWQQQALASSCQHHPCHGAEMSGNNRPWHHRVSFTLATPVASITAQSKTKDVSSESAIPM